MNRRAFLRILALGVVGHELDVDRLLWVPGSKKIFLPSKGLTESQIVAIELERIMPKVISLFERDNTFYTVLMKKSLPTISSREMRIPLVIEPGKKDES